jgi:hypothetical protein
MASNANPIALFIIFFLEILLVPGPFHPLIKRSTKEATNRTIKTKNKTRAIPTAAPAIPPNPNTPAISAMIRKITVHTNITLFLSFFGLPCNFPRFFSPNRASCFYPKKSISCLSSAVQNATFSHYDRAKICRGFLPSYNHLNVLFPKQTMLKQDVSPRENMVGYFANLIRTIRRASRYELIIAL